MLIMINLLPPQEKKDIFVRKKLKLVLVFEIGVFLLLTSLLTEFFSIVIYLSGELETVKITIAQKQAQTDLGGFSDFQAQISLLNQEFLDLALFYKRSSGLTKVLERVYAKLPPGSYLKNVSLSRDQKGRKVSLAGFMPTIESLLTFKKDLEKDKDLSKIDFPAANWVSSKNIDFTLSFELK